MSIQRANHQAMYATSVYGQEPSDVHVLSEDFETIAIVGSSALPGARGLPDRTSRPHQVRQALTESEQAQALAWRRQRWTLRRIAAELERPYATVRRLLERHHLNRLPPLQTPPPVIRYERERPGEMLHLDTKKLGRIVRPSHRVTGDRRNATDGAGWEVLHLAVDDHSRLAYTEVLADERQETATAFLERALAWFSGLGITVERVMTDNGGCYRSRPFNSALARHGIAHRLHAALHPPNQRQGRALRPDRAARVGLCLHLPALSRKNSAPRPLATLLQSSPSTYCPRIPATLQPDSRNNLSNLNS